MRTFLYGRELLKALAVSVFFIFPVTAKQHPDAHIQLLRPVELTAQEQLFVSTLPTLKIASHKQAPPMSLHDRYADKYTGISVDWAVSKSECNTVNELMPSHYRSTPSLYS